jgi:hypothetical protein
MPRNPFPCRSALLPALAGAAVALVAAPALAQSESCQQFGKILKDRESIVQKLNAAGNNKNKKMDPKSACSLFGSLVANGEGAVKWLEANKDWCQIPDQFITGIKGQHAQAVSLRGQACKVAAQQIEIEKKAKQGGGSGLLGGEGLTGSFRMPQGAL